MLCRYVPVMIYVYCGTESDMGCTGTCLSFMTYALHDIDHTELNMERFADIQNLRLRGHSIKLIQLKQDTRVSVKEIQ